MRKISTILVTAAGIAAMSLATAGVSSASENSGVFRHECGSAEGCGGRVTLGGNGVGSSCRAADLYPFR